MHWLVPALAVVLPSLLPADDLSDSVASILARPELAGSSAGILVREVPSGKVVFAHQPRALFAPASTTKLVSCAGSLILLGKDFRFVTPVVRTGAVEDGVVRGDLVLVSSGDPNLSQRLTKDGRLLFKDKDHTYAGFTDAESVDGDPLAVLRSLARQVRDAGVREVAGDVVVDDGLFSDSADSFVGSFSAVSVNDNAIDVFVTPGAAEGAAAEVQFQPKLDCIQVRSEVVTGAPGSETTLWVEVEDGPAAFVVRGTIGAGSKPVLRVGQLRSPALAAAHFLAEVLAGEGVRVRGSRRQARQGPKRYEKLDVVAKHVSAPFSEAMRVTLKVSHNLHATMFPVLVGALKAGRGETRAGYGLIRDVFARGGLDVGSVVLQSGSGGGRADSLSALFLVDLLDFMARRPEFPEFYDALPVGGIDGTLAARFAGSPLRGRVHAKTGTLVYQGTFNDRWVYLSKALAGYLDLRRDGSADGLLSFAILIANTVVADRTKGAEDLFRAQEDILEAVARQRGFVPTSGGNLKQD